MQAIQKKLLSVVEHVTYHDPLCKVILQEAVQGNRTKERQKKSWYEDIKEWTQCSIYKILHGARNRKRQKTLIIDASFIIPLQPMTYFCGMR